MSPDSIRALSISALKSIMFTNHVNVGNILEKGDLVSKVIALVEDEKRERDRMRLVGEMEEMERVQRELEREREANVLSSTASTARNGTNSPEGDWQEQLSEPTMGSGEEAGDTKAEKNTLSNLEAQLPNTKEKFSPTSNMSALERSGLCVVCQDEEANIAIVDCGYV
jgi:hypothetical protein